MAGWCEIFITDQLPFFKDGGFPPIALWLHFLLQFVVHSTHVEGGNLAHSVFKDIVNTSNNTQYVQFFNTYKMLDLSFVYLLIRELITSLQFLYCVFRHCCLWILGNWERSFSLARDIYRGENVGLTAFQFQFVRNSLDSNLI